MSTSVEAAAPAREAAEAVGVDMADVRRRVQRSLDAFLDRQAGVLAEVGPELVRLLDVATEFVTGGKRLRAAFCYWGWRGAGGPDCDAIVDASAALELFQAAALVHDDLMDDSDTRRGRPSVHRRLAMLHRDEGYTGSADRFGAAGAVLLGDLFLTWSDELLAGSGLGAPALQRGRHVFDTMRSQLMAGQYLDVLDQARPHGPASLERARRVIRFKSAKYTVEHPLLLGGSLAGAGRTVLDAYSSYGLLVGEAFQLRDDVLGVFGDPVETGKPAGDDLREGKRTVLVALASSSATPAQAALLDTRLGDPALDDDAVVALREVLVDTGALATVESRIDTLAREAIAVVDAVTLADGAGPVLRGLVAAATTRVG